MGIRPNRSRTDNQKKEEMITIIIIICLTVILIVAIICYKEYRLKNSSDLNWIESELKSLRLNLEFNNRILCDLSDSIREFKEEIRNENRTSK